MTWQPIYIRFYGSKVFHLPRWISTCQYTDPLGHRDWTLIKSEDLTDEHKPCRRCQELLVRRMGDLAQAAPDFGLTG